MMSVIHAVGGVLLLAYMLWALSEGIRLFWPLLLWLIPLTVFAYLFTPVPEPSVMNNDECEVSYHSTPCP